MAKAQVWGKKDKELSRTAIPPLTGEAGMTGCLGPRCPLKGKKFYSPDKAAHRYCPACRPWYTSARVPAILSHPLRAAPGEE